MMTKICILACIGAIFVQNISSQCIGAYNGYADGLAWGPANACDPAPWAAPFAAPFAAAEWGAYSPATLSASNGGGLAVTSASPIAPTGVAMTSENAYEGVLAVTGALPFLAAVSLEGVLPTGGVGAVTYSCGNGNVAILNEDIVAPGYIAGPLGYRAEFAGPLAFNGLGGPYGYEAGMLDGHYGYSGCGARMMY